MKVSIIGGGGLVGSCAAFALQCGGIVSGLDLIDVNGDLCRGQALDLLHGSSIAADQRIRATGYEAIPESDLICITAGLRRKPDESRLDLINRNVELFLNILSQVKAAGPKKSAIVLVVSNPVDVLTYLATLQLGLPSTQVIGLGTELDSARFRSLIAESLKLPPTQVTATILGEHGDSMVPIWSAAQAAGLPLGEVPGLDLRHGRRPLRQDPRQRRRGDQAQRRGRVRRRPGDPRRHPRDRPRQQADLAGRLTGERDIRDARRLHLGADRRRPRPASRLNSRSSSGRRKSRPCGTRARFFEGRSTPCSSRTPTPPKGRACPKPPPRRPRTAQGSR